MKATIKIEFVEQSKGVTAQAKVELEGPIEEITNVRLRAQEEAEKAFNWAFNKSQAYTMRK